MPIRAAVRATFQHLGVEAIFDPDGDRHSVRLIPVSGEDLANYETTGVVASVFLYEIQAEEWQLVSDVRTFEVGGQRRQVKGAPRQKDPRRHILVLDSQPI